MKIRSALLCAFFFACSTFHVVADCISIQVLQRDPFAESVSDTTLLIESSLMDTFFDRGAIVTSNAIVTVTKSIDEERLLQQDFAEAIDGNVDRLIVIDIQYGNQSEINPNIVKVSTIKKTTWAVYSVRDKKKLYEGSLEPSVQELKSDDRKGLQLFASRMAQDISKQMWK